MKLEDKYLLTMVSIIIAAIWLISTTIHFLSDEYLWIKIPIVATVVLMGIFWIAWLVAQMTDEKDEKKQEVEKISPQPLDKPNENP